MSETLCEKLIVTLGGGERIELAPKPDEVIVQTLWNARQRPPVSCCRGECGTCMARVVKGTVAMHHNGVLSQGEVDQGYVLTCQGVPTAPEVEVVYED